MTAMAVKKERGRFSLRFNISDPIHLATVELLEKQPDHGKAQYIANAVVFYDTHFADDPQPLRAAAPAPAIDRAAIEAIVREILRQEARDSEKPARLKKQQRPRRRRNGRRSRNMRQSWERQWRQMMRSSA